MLPMSAVSITDTNAGPPEGLAPWPSLRKATWWGWQEPLQISDLAGMLWCAMSCFTRPRVAGWVFALTVAAPVSLFPSRLERGPTCEPTRSQNLLSDVVGRAFGSHPAWMADDDQPWQGGAHPVKTLWILERTSEEVRIQGRQLDGPGVLSFRRLPEAASDTLVIRDPSRTTVIPGGASAAVMRTYAFVPSYVFYPGPGCWEIVVGVGAHETRIVREVSFAR